MAKASPGTLVSFLGLRSQLASGTEVLVMACSPRTEIRMQSVVLSLVLDIWSRKNLRRSHSLSPTWLQ